MTHDVVVGLVADVASRFLEAVVALEPTDWERPGLGEWTVRELVGHTVVSFGTVDTFLDVAYDEVDVRDAGEYYRLALSSSPDIHAQVAQRGRDAGAGLGDDPAAAAVEAMSATLGRLVGTTGDEIGMVRLGRMAVTPYLETRLVELVVHHTDLCAAVGMPTGELGDATLAVATTVLRSATADDRVRVLRSALGREPLPAGFSVWP